MSSPTWLFEQVTLDNFHQTAQLLPHHLKIWDALDELSQLNTVCVREREKERGKNVSKECKVETLTWYRKCKSDFGQENRELTYTTINLSKPVFKHSMFTRLLDVNQFTTRSTAPNLFCQ